MFLYLWAMFALFALHEKIVLREVGASLPSQGFAFVNALVLAKVMLIAEDLNLGNWLQGRPLIFPILHELCCSRCCSSPCTMSMASSSVSSTGRRWA